jgi:hypothetical protein
MRFVWSALMLVAAGVFPLVGEPSPEAVSGRLASSMRPSDVSPDLAPTTAAAEPELRDSRLSIRSIETHIGTDGAQEFVIVFDGSVPDARIGYFDDINHVDSSRVGYTTQEWTPERPTPLSTCGDQHFGFSPPAIVGQVDVLMPGDWFGTPPVADKIIWERHPKAYGLKTPLCGPHNGYVQFAIWSPASHDPDDIRVYFDDLTRLVVEIRPVRG